MSISRVIDGIRLDDDELRTVLAEAKATARREQGIMVPLVLYGCPIAIGFGVTYGGRFITPFVSLNRFMQALSIAAVIGLLAFLGQLAYRPIHDWLMLRHLRRAMHRRGYDLCAECGYWLTELDETVTRCPECGASHRPVAPSSIDTSGTAQPSLGKPPVADP